MNRESKDNTTECDMNIVHFSVIMPIDLSRAVFKVVNIATTNIILWLTGRDVVGYQLISNVCVLYFCPPLGKRFDCFAVVSI